MRCYQCRRELGRNAHWLRYCRHPFCKECAGQRECDSVIGMFVNGRPVHIIRSGRITWFTLDLSPKEVKE